MNSTQIIQQLSLNSRYLIKNHVHIYRTVHKEKQSTCKIIQKRNWQANIFQQSEHPTSVKNSIPYNQALQIKKHCSTAKDSGHHTQELKEIFVKQAEVNSWKKSQRNFTKITFH